MEKASRYARILGSVYVGMVFLALYFMAFIATGPKQNWSNDILVTIVIIIITSGLFHTGKNHSHLGAKIRDLDAELELLRNDSALDLTKVFGRLNEYDCLLMVAPILPDFIYHWNKPELDAAWEKRQQEK
jgi:hypothetical protein